MKNYTKIVTVAYFYFFLLLEFNCVTQFDTCCINLVLRVFSNMAAIGERPWHIANKNDR